MTGIFRNKLLALVSILTPILLIFIALDLIPFLRGPAPYPPEWQWDYLFVNTLEKIWVPVLAIMFIFGMYIIAERRKLSWIGIIIFLSGTVIASYLFQMGVLYFSRAGIGVLIHRVINPELNGYFTASLNIKSIYDFLSTYNDNFLNFVYHAASHPPGAILFFHFNNLIVSLFPFFVEAVSGIEPSRPDVKMMWEALTANQKAGAVFSAFIIPMLSSLAIVPLFFAARKLYGAKTAVRSVFIYIFIPSVILFIPINDTFLPLFSAASFLFFYKGLKERSKKYFFLSGSILFSGVFFNLSLLPIGLFFAILYSLVNLKEKFRPISKLRDAGMFAGGFLLLPVIFLLFFNFNFYEMTRIIMTTVTHVNSRSYSLWLGFNAIDFFIFAGIPLSIIFFYKFFISADSIIKNKLNNFLKKIGDPEAVFLSFLIMLVIVNFSGSIRGEAGRILAVYMPFMAIIGAGVVSKNLKLSTYQFGVILIFQAMQILVMQEFWVLLW